MSFDWTDYLKLAKKLLDAGHGSDVAEASYRSATSRAYYAAYHVASIFAQTEGYIPYGSGDDHQGVARYFREAAGNRYRLKIAAELDRMRKARNQADYATVFRRQSPKAMADLTVRSAARVIEILEKLEA
ncbi:MAG: DNA-binding protein [Chloroflexi bacterium]|nr:DNA-binding protein [Chloroflexota bacterium]